MLLSIHSFKCRICQETWMLMDDGSLRTIAPTIIRLKFQQERMLHELQAHRQVILYEAVAFFEANS